MAYTASTPPAGYVPDPADVEKNKIIAVLANLGILFFLPLIVCPESPFGRFYANRGLLVFLFSIASSIVSFVPWIGNIISGIIGLICLVIVILSIVDAVNGRTAPLPILGDIVILK